MSETWVNQTIAEMRSNADQGIQDLAGILLKYRTAINKTVTSIDKSTGEVVILSLQKYK